MLLSAFGLISLLYVWLRLPHTVIGAIAPALATIALGIFAIVDVAYAGKTGADKPSQWWLVLLLPVALAAGAIHHNWQFSAAGFRTFSIPVRSMAPTLPFNSHVVVDSRRYLHDAPQRGDIVVFVAPQDNRLFLAKRLIAVGGDRLEVRGDTVLVNGKAVSEPYAIFNGPLPDVAEKFGPLELPMGTAFVMGDNRHDSFDSRMYGPVNMTSIRGKVIYVILSFHVQGRTFD